MKGRVPMYDSEEVPKICQEAPLVFKNQSFKLKSWTETVTGYLNEADKLSRCILNNHALMGRGYTWEVTINVEVELPPEQIKSVCDKVCRKLRERGVVALWVREPSRTNRCNYHLIVKNEIPQAELARAIEESMPDRSELAYHKHIRPIVSQFHYARYITKAKTRGYINNREVADKYKRKRLLFRPHLKLRKYGTIGDFWEKPKKEIWQDIIEIEKRIAEGLAKPNIKKLAHHVHEMFGQCVPLSTVERSYGYMADEPNIRDWADRLFADEDQ